MYCTKCGSRLNGNAYFCHSCGDRIQQPETEQLHAARTIESEPVIPEIEPISEESVYGEPFEYDEIEPCPVPVIEPLLTPPPPEPPEKIFFGKPAFVLCLVIIGLLSAACSALATLYFGGINLW